MRISIAFFTWSLVAPAALSSTAQAGSKQDRARELAKDAMAAYNLAHLDEAAQAYEEFHHRFRVERRK